MKKMIALPAALLLALTLAACGNAGDSKTSGAGSDGAAQTVEQACEAATTQMEAFATKYEEANTELMADPSKGIELIKTMKTDLESAGSGITNAEVKTAWDSFSKGFGELAAAAESQDTAALQTATTTMMEGATKIGELCPQAN